MKLLSVIPLACLILASGCASSGRMSTAESDIRTNQKLLRETDHRLRTLEQGVSALDGQMAQLNGRVYEVRTRDGKKTGLAVVPIIPPQPSKSPSAAVGPNTGPTLSAHGPEAGSQSAASAPPPAVQAMPTPQAAPAGPANGRRIDPAVPPRPLPASASGASPSTGVQTPTAKNPAVAKEQAAKAANAAPQGVSAGAASLPAAAGAPAVIGLPPEAAPADPAPAPLADHAAKKAARPAAGSGDNAAGGNAAIPVPVLPLSEMALPPEHPGLGLPPVDAAPGPVPTPAPKAVTPSAPPAAQAAAAPQPSAPARSGKGEEAAYKAALQPALAGRPAESIGRFQAFLQEYPQGRYAANADYWIGEGLYAQGKYQEALAQFQKVDAAWPRHHKNADALLKAGMTMGRLGDKEGASQTFKKLQSLFPDSEAARIARSRGLTR